MGCINGKSLLREEDLNYIARNTAMDKEAVEVPMLSGLIFVLSEYEENLKQTYKFFLICNISWIIK